MIDFRYHIVSLVGVFLALGLGILLGSTVLSGPLTDRFESDLRRARDARNAAQQRADQLDADLRSRDELITDEIAPWMLSKRLEGRTVLFVLDGQTNRWRDAVRDSILKAGATPAGNLVLTDKWRLDREGSVQELVDLVMRPVIPSFDPGPRPAESALQLLGQRLPEPTGQALVARMVESDFAIAEGREGTEPWPPSGSVVVAFAGASAPTSPQPGWLASFALGSAQVTGTLVVSGSAEEHSAVTILRGAEESPRRLSTFDSGTNDPGGVGAVIALDVAIAERGGHFGTEANRRYIPQPA